MAMQQQSGEPSGDPTLRDRQRWMSVLAKAKADDLQALWRSYPDKPAWQRLRQPETGMVMVRARAGGTGRRFNCGEMTVTRCSVRLADGRTGHGYVAGRSREHAELAAVVDALMQGAAERPAVEGGIIRPLEQRQREARLAASKKAAATRVDFFTLVRGD